MQIVPFPAYYQSVYTNFDFTSFSLISWHEREALLKVKRGSLYNKETPSLNGEKLNL